MQEWKYKIRTTGTNKRVKAVGHNKNPSPMASPTRRMLFIRNGIRIIVSILILLFCSCRSKNKQKTNILDLGNGKDSITYISLFDLRPYSDSSSKNKKKIVSDAIRQTITETEIDDYSERPLSDFYIIDIDKDGDNDIIYSSLVDQYRRTDGNGLFIFQNNKGKFIRYIISGYLYSTDLFDPDSTKDITFKTVMRPCCDYSYYTFFVTKFNITTWKFTTTKTKTVEKKKVEEVL